LELDQSKRSNLTDINFLVGKIIGYVYRSLFEWWLDAPAARRAQERFAAEIRNALPFLFENQGGTIVPTDSVKFPPGFDYAFVTVAIGQLLFRFVQGRGEFRIDMTVSGTGKNWRDWKDLRQVEVVLKEADSNGNPLPLRNLNDASLFFEGELARLKELGVNPGEWDLVKRKINALFPPLVRIR
jgi:hypothetical protein